MTKLDLKSNARLATLPKAVQEDLHIRLVRGDSLTDIGKWLHASGHMLTYQLQSLIGTLSKFKKRHLAEIVKSLQADGKVAALDGSSLARLNTLMELEGLALAQRERVAKVLSTEKKGPLLMKAVSDAMAQYRAVLVELARVQMETGVIQRAPKSITGTVVDDTGRLRQFSWTEETAKLTDLFLGNDKSAA